MPNIFDNITDETGTRVTFKPDGEIFEELVYDYETLHTRLREQAFLNAGVRMTITDRRTPTGPSDSMCYEGGIRSFVEFIHQRRGLEQRAVRCVVRRIELERHQWRAAIVHRADHDPARGKMIAVGQHLAGHRNHPMLGGQQVEGRSRGGGVV